MTYEDENEDEEIFDERRLYEPGMEGPLVEATDDQLKDVAENLRTLAKALNDELVEGRKMGLVPTLNLFSGTVDCTTKGDERVVIDVVQLRVQCFREL